MRIGIIGAGAIGGYFGGILARAGHQVTFVARGEPLAALRRTGLRIESPLGDFALHPVDVIDDPAGGEVCDLVLVCVKAWQVVEAARGVRPLVGPATCVLPMQNGVEAAAQLAGVLGPEPVLDAMCKIISRVEAPGHIVHVGVDPYIAFGERDDEVRPRTRALRQAFAEAGIEAEIPPSIRAAVWSKFLFIATVSGLGAVTRTPLGPLRERPETRNMLTQALREIEAVARAYEVPLAADVVPATLRFIDSLPAAGTTSMQRDIMDGRPSELEAQNGAVVRLGKKAGVPTPLNAFLYHSLLPMETRARQGT